MLTILGVLQSSRSKLVAKLIYCEYETSDSQAEGLHIVALFSGIILKLLSCTFNNYLSILIY